MSTTLWNIPDYDLIKQIGQGAYGEVWLAREQLTGVYRAIKIIRPSSSGNFPASARDLAGVRTYQQRIKPHPNLVQVLHVGRSGHVVYYVMELADDRRGLAVLEPESYVPRTLAEEIRTHTQLSTTQAVEYVVGILSGLVALHDADLVHRDIKPSNIVFKDRQPCLVDVGLVTSQGSEMTQVGTLGYMPPEGLRDRRCDVYATGKVVYEMISGLPIGRFPELPTEQLDEPGRWQVGQVNRIISRACHPDPSKRYQHAREMLAGARRCHEISPSQALRLGGVSQRIKRALLAAAAVAVIVAGALLIRHWLPTGSSDRGVWNDEARQFIARVWSYGLDSSGGRQLYSEIASALEDHRDDETWRIGWELTSDGDAYLLTVRHGSLFVNRMAPDKAAVEGFRPNRVAHNYSHPPALPVNQIWDLSVEAARVAAGQCVGTFWVKELPGFAEPEDVTFVVKRLIQSGTAEVYQTAYSDRLVESRAVAFSVPLSDAAVRDGSITAFLRGWLYHPKPRLYRLSNEVPISLSPTEEQTLPSEETSG